ncbi:hypothetical protein A9R01_08270 ['Osedax' symbiont bacterium Rs2_46_30_T18]|nr:hypothetical protein A9R01_08270 ['Osedax' symbiont bacterium Rs2_46_30_T18]
MIKTEVIDKRVSTLLIYNYVVLIQNAPLVPQNNGQKQQAFDLGRKILAVRMRSGLLIATLFAPLGLSSQAPIWARFARLEPCEGLPTGCRYLGFVGNKIPLTLPT